MPQYTFDSLSPLDFELLVRDLLQEELGERFESFSTGADEGIDLRHAKSDSGATVVQCKHYANTAWKDLLRSYRSERAKAAILNPERYIAATSHRLSPRRKRKIVEALTPFCRRTDEVLGRSDLNNLLGRHPQVETAHFKLWLTSVPVLQRVLKSGIFAEQASLLGALKRRISRYVVNPSFARASGILSETGFCMITGIPGIGKTTLAEMLVVDHIERGFECFRLTESISEAREVLSMDRDQLFYFDDFLGRTGLREPSQRNEDTRLLAFIEDVLESPHTKLVLTTREYILNQAKSFMEALAETGLEQAECVVQMEDFTPRIRAEILYNHLFYSETPREHVKSLIGSGVYRDIVRHSNYNPRIIDAMTRNLHTQSIPPEEYPEAFLANLDNPHRIWRVAYEEHIGNAAQDLLLALCSLPERVANASLQRAFWKLHNHRKQKYNAPGSAYSYKRAFKELGGSFIRSMRYKSADVVEVQNPSVRDFLEEWLRHHPMDVEDLVACAEFNEQIEKLWGLAKTWQDRDFSAILETLAERFIETFESCGVRLRATRNDDNAVTNWRECGESVFRRFNRVVTLLSDTDTTLAASAVERLLPYLSVELENSYLRDCGEVSRFLLTVRAGKVPGVDENSEVFAKAVHAVFVEHSGSRDAAEYMDAAELLDLYPDVIDGEVRSSFIEDFLDACECDLENAKGQGHPDDRDYWYTEWEDVANYLDVWMPIDREDVVGYGVEEDYVPPRASRVARADPGSAVSDKELDSLFGSLLEEEPSQ